MGLRRALITFALVVLSGGGFAAATGETGAVAGTVKIPGAASIPPRAAYRGQTRAPVGAADAPRAVVYLETPDGRYPPAPKGLSHSIPQRGYQFRPGLSAVRLGTAVSFPNRDPEFHSVFSYSQTQPFDLGRFRQDEPSPPVTFNQPGLARIYCEIHRHMRSRLLVLETPWFTLTDPAGRFSLSGVPAGEYLLQVFLPDESRLEIPVQISAGETLQLGPLGPAP